jgi:preprotein translocase subunit YajC
MGGAGFFLIIVAFGFLYFVLVRPQKKRQLAQQAAGGSRSATRS